MHESNPKKPSWTLALTFLWMPLAPIGLFYILEFMPTTFKRAWMGWASKPAGLFLLLLFIAAPLVCFGAAIRLASYQTAFARFLAAMSILGGLAALVPLYVLLGAYGMSQFGH